MLSNHVDFFELYDVKGNPISGGSGETAKAGGLTLGDALSNKIKMALLEKSTPELRLYGPVDEEMADYVRQAIMFLESGSKQPPIKVVITSNGGSVIAGMEIFSLLSDYEGGAHGYVTGYAYSAAAQYILQGCLIRYAHRYSNLMCHYVHMGLYVGENDLSPRRNKLVQARKGMKDFNDQTVRILMQRTGRTEAEVRKFLCQGHVKPAQEFKDFGLLDAVYCSETVKTLAPDGSYRFSSHAVVDK